MSRNNLQLWLYGETVHGVRSSDVNCVDNPNVAVCRGPFDVTNPAERALFILREASSLEGFVGVRLEFLRTRLSQTEHVARAYVKGQLGFLTVEGRGGDVVDMHHVAIGLTASNGPYQDSYLEIGYGINDLFAEINNRGKRFTTDAFLSWTLGPLNPFAQIVVDTDIGDGADSIQSYFGIDFDLAALASGLSGTSSSGGSLSSRTPHP